MTDGLDQALADAGLALLNADLGPPALVVYDGVVGPSPDVLRGYVLVYTSIDRPADDPDNAMNGQSRVWVIRWICHCVGATADAARAVAQRVRTQLLDVRPIIVGLSCDRITLEPGALPPQRDETTGTAVMDAVLTFRMRATS